MKRPDVAPRIIGGLLALTLTTVAAPARAQDTIASRAPELVKSLSVTRLPGTVTLDGRLDEAAWSQASFHDDFMQKGKDRAFPARIRTRIALMYDEEALYVGATMERDGESGVGSTAVGRRDDPGPADRILVSLDTYRDRQTAYTFGVSAGGVRIDYVSARDNETWTDDSFDPVWQARVTNDSTSWSAEMRIPFSQLRFAPGVEQVWGLNVRRFNPTTFLNTYWVVVPYYETGWTSRFGEMRGIAGIDGGAGVEVTPYVLGQATYHGSPPGEERPSEARSRVGGDLKMGLGSSMTLDATVNPDFGQVEADPARVNLSAFETFFPERRPFFTEGTELFRVRGPNYFYSRRVGAIPAGAIPRSLFERVQSSTVLGGAKLTGRIGSGLGVGGILALTDDESVRLSADPADGPEAGGPRLAAAPQTVFGVGRARQDVGTNGSAIGFMGTAVERMFAADDGLDQILPRRAFAGGADWTLRFGDRRYEATGHVGGSRVVGEPSALLRLQESSAHYFQRPDADHLSLDPDLTEMTGWAGGLSLAKTGGAPWLWNLGLEARSPSFEIRDAGSQIRSDVVDASAGIVYQTRDGGGALRDRAFGVSAASGWNFGGVRRSTSVSASAFLAWGNQWSTHMDGGVALRSTSDDLTRGGPLMGTPLAGWLNAGLTTSPSSPMTWSVDGTSYFDELGGWSGSLSGGWDLQASDRLVLAVYLGLSGGDDARQFTWLEENPGAATYGMRYIFSTLERRELFATLRAKIAFAPDAVLTLYGQPFVSAGRFHDFGELTAPGAADLRMYGDDGTSVERLEDGSWLVTDGATQFTIPSYDFWVRSFRGTGVFRWEWRRGSTLHLIWQRTLSAFDERYGATGAGNLFDALADPGQNTFVVKVSMLLDIR